MENKKEQPKPTPEQRKIALQKILIYQKEQEKEKKWNKKGEKYFTSILEECNGSTSSFDYNLTLDTKKEISMLQRTEKGKEDSILLNYTRFIDNFNIVLKRIKTLAHFWAKAQEAELSLIMVQL